MLETNYIEVGERSYLADIAALEDAHNEPTEHLTSNHAKPVIRLSRLYVRHRGYSPKTNEYSISSNTIETIRADYYFSVCVPVLLSYPTMPSIHGLVNIRLSGHIHDSESPSIILNHDGTGVSILQVDQCDVRQINMDRYFVTRITDGDISEKTIAPYRELCKLFQDYVDATEVVGYRLLIDSNTNLNTEK